MEFLANTVKTNYANIHPVGFCVFFFWGGGGVVNLELKIFWNPIFFHQKHYIDYVQFNRSKLCNVSLMTHDHGM